MLNPSTLYSAVYPLTPEAAPPTPPLEPLHRHTKIFGPEASTLNFQIKTLNPTPETLNPKPQTLNPQEPIIPQY
jgi:hypothetical protein